MPSLQRDKGFAAESHLQDVGHISKPGCFIQKGNNLHMSEGSLPRVAGHDIVWITWSGQRGLLLKVKKKSPGGECVDKEGKQFHLSRNVRQRTF